MSVLILTKRPDEYENIRLNESFAKKNISTTFVHPDNFDLVVKHSIDTGINYSGLAIDKPKLLLTRTGSGTNDFARALIRQFEEENIPCINGSESIGIAKDKLRTSQLLSKKGIPIPNTMLVRFPVEVDLVEANVGWPCVVKIINGSYGEGIYLCERRNDFRKLMEFVSSLKSGKTLIVQEYVGYKPGEDLRVLVVGGKVIGSMKRVAPSGDFRANISNGGHGEPFPLTEEIDYIARETARVCGLQIAGIDLLFDKTGFKVCEANSAPGFEGFEQYCGIDVAEHITEFVKFKLNGLTVN
jgi:RimK family alpha-L-glutamate ligase